MLTAGPSPISDHLDSPTGAGSANYTGSIFGGLRGYARQTPEGRTLHSLTEMRLTEVAEDNHGDQSSGIEMCEPVIHPTFEARYFFKREIQNRDAWSRDLRCAR
jgi:hypothetical protein